MDLTKNIIKTDVISYGGKYVLQLQPSLELILEPGEVIHIILNEKIQKKLRKQLKRAKICGTCTYG